MRLRLSFLLLVAGYCVHAQPAYFVKAVPGNGFDAGASIVDAHGNLFFIDRGNATIKKISTDGTITTIAGTGSISSVGGEGDNGPATLVPFGHLVDLAIDIDGNIFLSESNASLNQYSRLRRIDAVSGIIETIAGTGEYGFSGDGGLATEAKIICGAIAIDPGGNPYFVDGNGTFRIRAVNLATGTITTVAGGGGGADGGAAIDAALAQTIDLAFDAIGNFFIAERYRIRKVDTTTGIITTIAGDGTAGFSGDGGPAIASKFNRIRNIEFDETGNLFIGDWLNLRVRLIDPTGQLRSVAGGGSIIPDGAGVLASDALVSPSYLSVGKDTLYISAESTFQKIYKDRFTQHITFPALAAKTVGSPAIRLKASSSSGLPVTFESTNPAIATVDGNIATLVGVGTVDIIATQPGNEDFRPALATSQTLLVTKGAQLIYFPSLSPKFSGDLPVALSAFSTASLPVSYSSSNLSVATVSGNTLTIVGVGSTTITASQAGNVNYDAAPNVSQTLTVHPSTQVIDFLAIPAKKFGDARFELTASSPTGLPILFASSNPAVISISGSVATVVGAGSVTIAASHLGDATHAPALVTQTVNVSKADQVITLFIDGAAPRNAGEDPFDPHAWASSGLSVVYESSNPAVASVEGGLIRPRATGETIITVFQTGNENFNQAPSQTFTLKVSPSSPYSLAHQLGNNENDLHFFYPRGMVTDQDGNIYVACSQENRIKKFSREGVFLQTIGSRGASAGFLSAPHDVDILGEEIFVLDRGNGRIQVFSALGKFKRLFGSKGSGAGQLQNAAAFSVSPQGFVYIADTGNNRIVVFSKDGNFLFSLGSFGTALAQFKSPLAVATDADGYVYVLDAGNYRVQVFNANGDFIRVFGKNGSGDGEFFFTPKSLDLTPDGDVIVLSPKQGGGFSVETFDKFGLYKGNFELAPIIPDIYHPQSTYLAVHGNDILVSDPLNYHIELYDNGQLVKRFGEITSETANGQLKSWVNGITRDHAGNVYVANGGNIGFGYVKVLAADGTFIRTFGRSGTHAQRLSDPTKLVVDASGTCYVADQLNSDVRVFDSNGTYVRSIGSAGSGIGEFGSPSGIALDANGWIYVTDASRHTVQVFEDDGNPVTQFGTMGTGDGQFYSPKGIFIDGEGRIFVVDDNGVQIFDANRNFLSKVEGGGNSVRVNSDGRIFVSTTDHMVNVYNRLGAYLYSIGSYGTEGGGHIYGTSDVSLDEDNGKILISDYLNTIHVFGIPKMELRQTNLIASGSSYDFGQIDLASQLQKSFSIRNTGNSLLKLGPPPALTGSGASDFLIGGWNTNSTIAPDAETNFAITFKPTMGGVRMADIEVFTNDVSATPFVVHLNGAGTKRIQAITFNPIPHKVYNDNAFLLSAASSSQLPISFFSSDETVATVTGNTLMIVGAGTATITASQEGNDTYNAAPDATQLLTVNKANNTITFGSFASKTYGDDMFSLAGTATSGLPITYTSSDETVATIAGSTVTIVGAGTTTITATQAGNNNYEAAPDVAQVLTVNKGNQAIAFTSLPAKAFGDASFSLSASTTSGLPVTFTSSNETVATVTGSTVTIVGAGSTVITASQGGNANYAEATSVTQTLVVDKIGQAITFTSIPDKTLGGANFDLSATSTSNLPVSFSTTSDKVSIANTTVSLLKAGRVAIKGDQAGDANHEAAPTVEQSFCINPPKPAIALTNVNTEAPILTSSNDAGNQWYLNGAAIVDGTQKTLTATLSGTYTVQTKVDDCAGEISEPQVLIITGDLKNMTSTTQLELYPNPVQDYLVVEWKSDKRGELVFQVIDALGRTIEVGNGYSNQPNKIPMGSLKPGTYFLRVQNGREVHSKIFLKQ